MSSARDLLVRFRPVGSPGAAAPVGVPADRVAERERELRSVFAELAASEDEAAGIRAAATADATARVATAADSARAIVNRARRDAEAHRTDAASTVLREAQQDAAALRSAARREAAEIAARAHGRLPDLVARMVDAVRGDVPVGLR